MHLLRTREDSRLCHGLLQFPALRSSTTVPDGLLLLRHNLQLSWHRFISSTHRQICLCNSVSVRLFQPPICSCCASFQPVSSERNAVVT
jgi:hypothetical protein